LNVENSFARGVLAKFEYALYGPLSKEYALLVLKTKGKTQTAERQQEGGE
jgi:hypothetical protein